MRVQRDGRQVTVTVTADGDENVVGHAGAALLAETADRVGLTGALSDVLAGLRQRRGGHDPGRVVRDLAVMLADGGDALCDLRALRDQPALFGAVASDSTAWRVIDDIAEVGLLDVLRAARATARERAFALGAGPTGPLVIDIDATLVTAHSDKDGTGGTYKGGCGFHPLREVTLDSEGRSFSSVVRITKDRGVWGVELSVEGDYFHGPNEVLCAIEGRAFESRAMGYDEMRPATLEALARMPSSESERETVRARLRAYREDYTRRMSGRDRDLADARRCFEAGDFRSAIDAYERLDDGELSRADRMRLRIAQERTDAS